MAWPNALLGLLLLGLGVGLGLTWSRTKGIERKLSDLYARTKAALMK